MLAALAVHYYRPDFTPGQAKSLIGDMVEDLAEFTVPEIEVAIRGWRKDASKRFFPRGAELAELIRADRKHRRTIGRTGVAVSEFGDSRPIMWWLQQRKFWKPHWREDEIPTDARGDSYRALKAQGKLR